MKIETAHKQIKFALKKKLEKKQLSLEKRPLIDNVLEQIECDLNNNETILYLVKAPTGYGKTTLTQVLGLYSIFNNAFFDKVIHVLPQRAIIEDAWENTNKLVKIATKKMQGTSETVFHLSPINFTTIDTFTWDIMKLNTKKRPRIEKEYEFGYDYFTQASIFNSLIVMDEVHYLLEDKLLDRAFQTLLTLLLTQKIPIILMSATITDKQRNRLGKLYNYITRKSSAGFREFNMATNDPFFVKEKQKKFHLEFDQENKDFKSISSLLDPDKRNIVIFNTIARAVNFYKSIEKGKGWTEKNSLLLHGAFTLGDKQENISKLEKIKDEESSFLIVSTQAIEAGVDISADIMITELAPPNNLIQRMGRVARKEEPQGRIIITKPVNARPYEKELMKRTETYLINDLAKGVAQGKVVQLGLHPRDPSSFNPFINTIGKNPKTTADENLLRFISLPIYRSVDVLNSFLRTRRDAFLRDFQLSALLSSKKKRKNNYFSQLRLPPWKLAKLMELQAIEMDQEIESLVHDWQKKGYNLQKIAFLLAKEQAKGSLRGAIIVKNKVYSSRYGLVV
ncbi:MAG: CRISPR-associated helicase Cas3' [Candidatus Heimdallarchaeota archaeon]|nr:CRISPR-associated helicase Cas3' [Candidatus Heimdallarchaeota archaeon]